MWSQQNPSLRLSDVGKVFIKNLCESVDNKAIYDTFSAFGKIQTCKVSRDENGNSKGYGFVHFETEEAANMSIEKLNGMLLNAKKIFVSRFIPYEERMKKSFTNVYIKNFGEDMTDDKLYEMFEPFGKIKSHKVMWNDGNGKSKRFGFVAFEKTEAAEAACNALNGKEISENKIVYVGRAQKKTERKQELRRKHTELKQERKNSFRGVNLYVKNLDNTIDDERLCKEFSLFGTVTSAKVMLDQDGRSKGFGFVCFNSEDQATRAVNAMHGVIFNGFKPLYISLSQRKQDRKAHLATQYMLQKSRQHMEQLSRMSQLSYAGTIFVPAIPQVHATPYSQLRPQFSRQPLPNTSRVIVGQVSSARSVQMAGRQ